MNVRRMRRVAGSSSYADAGRPCADGGGPDDAQMCCNAQSHTQSQLKQRGEGLMGTAAAAIAAAVLLATPLPAPALETAAPSEVIAAAKSLPQQKVDKGKVWLLLAGGSAVLFGATVFLERQTRLFPAISKANQAMSQSRTARQGGINSEQEQAEWDQLQQPGGQQDQQQRWADPDQVSVDPVLAGLQSASQRVLSTEEVNPQAAQTSSGHPAATSSSGKSGEMAGGMAMFHSSAAGASAASMPSQSTASSSPARQASANGAASRPDDGAFVEKPPPAAQSAQPPVAVAASEQPATAAEERADGGAAPGSTHEQASATELPATTQDGQSRPVILDLSDEELEREIAKRQQPVNLSELSDEDLRRELSKRQLAAGIVETVIDS